MTDKGCYMPRIRKLFTRLAIIIAVLFLILIVVLKMIESSQEQIEQGLESFLSQGVGYPAEIGELDRVTFFPVMKFDAKDIYFWSIEHPEDHLITIDRFRLSLPFWSVIFRTGKVNDFAVEGLFINEAVTGAAPVSVEKMQIDAVAASVVASLSAGEVQLKASMPLESLSDNGPPYRINREQSVITGTIIGERTDGSYNLLVSRDTISGELVFSMLDMVEMAPLIGLAQRLSLSPQQSKVDVRVERFSRGGGPYDFKALNVDEEGSIQPFSCLIEHAKTAEINADHPCGAYLKEE